jgi:hypothetical protein
MILAKLRRPVVSMLGDVMKETPPLSLPTRQNPPRRGRTPDRRSEPAERVIRAAGLRPGRRRTPSRMLIVGAVGLSLVLAGCGGAAAGGSSVTSSTQAASPAVTPTIAAQAPPAAAVKPANPDAGIPQGAGDGDPDNAGGPNDGDGAI